MKKLHEMLSEYSILYVEDNHEISEEVVFFLEPLVKSLYTAYNGEEGIRLYKEYTPDIIITDIQMPLMNGIDMIKNIRALNKTVSIIVTTAFNESSYLIDVINLNVDSYLIKPLHLKELLSSLNKTIEPLELRKEILTKNRELQAINLNLDAIAKEKTQKLEHLYNHDPLTGLKNFVSLTEAIESRKYKYLLLLDISNFSIMNKQYGKIFSNKILKIAGEALSKNATKQYQLFKAESDRFVFLTQEVHLEDIEEFCQQIISFFDTQALDVDELEVEINFSFGIAKIIDNYYPLINAEYALDIGKNLGSRYYYFYDESSDDIRKLKEMIKWLDITKELILEDKIEAYYQPIKDVNTGKITKYEVLARGNYEGKILSPYLFLGHAERLGLISSLTRIIVNKSFSYFSQTDMDFSINITQRDLLDKHLIGFFESKLESFNIDASHVTLEILENVSVGKEHNILIKQLHLLKSMGFKIAIDDFGMDNSNFARLLEIDFDYIKLDGVFIQNLETNKKDKIIVSAIVNLAKTLGVKTIAEYVESEALYEVIKECGVDMAQGYHIGRPAASIEE
ncbi:MAG: diguanylate cyclase [Sulfurimonas sp.]|nr:MAG: diguanylate cyclase [Sulfurimonas sp.]